MSSNEIIQELFILSTMSKEDREKRISMIKSIFGVDLHNYMEDSRDKVKPVRYNLVMSEMLRGI